MNSFPMYARCAVRQWAALPEAIQDWPLGNRAHASEWPQVTTPLWSVGPSHLLSDQPSLHLVSIKEDATDEG